MPHYKEYEVYRMKDKSEKFYTDKGLLPNIPFKICIVGKSQISGKTNLAGGLICLDHFFNNDFEGDDIYIVSPSATSDSKLMNIIKFKQVPKQNVLLDFNEGEIDAICDYIKENFEEAMEEKEKPVNSLIYFDDTTFGGKMKENTYGVIARIFCNMRHYNCSVILNSQVYQDLPTTCRRNASALMIFNISDKDLDVVNDEHNYLENKKDMKMLFRKNVKKKHSFFVINYSNDFKEMYQNDKFVPVTLEEGV